MFNNDLVPHIIKGTIVGNNNIYGAISTYICPTNNVQGPIGTCTNTDQPFSLFVVAIDKFIEDNIVTSFIISVGEAIGDYISDFTPIVQYEYTLQPDGTYFNDDTTSQVDGQIISTNPPLIALAPINLDPKNGDILYISVSFMSDPDNDIGLIAKFIIEVTDYDLPITDDDPCKCQYTSYLIPISSQFSILPLDLDSQASFNASQQFPNNRIAKNNKISNLPLNKISVRRKIKNQYYTPNIISQTNNCNQCPNVSFPRVFIHAALDDNLTTIRSVTLQIIDIYAYTLCTNKLCSHFVGIPTESIITIYAPDFYAVIKNCNCLENIPCNLISKTRNAVECICTDITSPSAGKVLVYGILIYVFSALLYNKFDVVYLERIHRCSFLKKLKESRFCRFAPLFTDPQFGLVGYENYYVL